MSGDARKPGRPPLDDRHPSVPVSIRIPAPQYDSFCQRAQRERVSVSTVIRRKLDDDDDDDD